MVCFPSVGGSGILATNLGRALSARGDEVHFVAYERPVRLSEGQNLFFHQIPLGRHEVFPFPDYTLPLACGLARICSEFELDIVHVHYAVPHAVAAVLARAMLKTKLPKLVVTLHGTDVSTLAGDRAYHAVIQHALSSSDAVTAVSDYLCQEAQRVFDFAQPVERVYNFCLPAERPGSRGGIRSRLGLRANETVALHMSNLRPVKRFDFVLRAFAESQVDRLIVLNGGDFEPYQGLVHELGLEDRLLVRKTSRVEDYIQASDMGLYASDEESFGLGILETMLGARPVVATSVGGVGEVVGETGLLAPKGDHLALTRGLNRLAHDQDLRLRLGQDAQRRALTEFSLARALDSYTSIYQRVLEKTPGPLSPTPLL